MKKIFLKIKNPGIMFQLGNKKFRSPAEIDVTHLKVDNIISQMRIYGITDFEITTNEPKQINEKQKTNIIVIETRDNEIEELNLKINKIEKVLKDLLNQNKREQNNIEFKKIKETEIEIKPDIECRKQPSSQPQISSKNILIEELEESEEFKKLNEPKDNKFKVKDFKLGIVDPFITLSDVDQLKVFKKKLN